ncbi:MAG: NAD(P)H-dependent oxidoreductase subunit E [Actinomycetes bacterium]|nr:NAD(P)H-dependent oxidoreductase subunit E [Actinomycetes bacterium]MDX5380548.1 NAD(P)H-dependent oxidoreductase subunit E [Actinomycetes bacterium]MDX5399437.1 NAD(P)H-dependent oxidoreductase subunit E [Actinomycetes bacterium]MDX5450288.1 NAD(P)H-dependent oxidoreductase subunit E [Actinomycetes bacterium]
MLTHVPDDVVTAHPEIVAAVDEAVARHGAFRGALIPVLQDLRQQLPLDGVVQQLVADRLGVPPVEVYGVVSFYSFLGTSVSGTHVIRLCRTLSCEMQGARDIAAVLEEELGIGFGETTADGMFTLEWANCIGQCDAPPAMLVGHRAVGHLSAAAVRDVLAALRAEAATA